MESTTSRRTLLKAAPAPESSQWGAAMNAFDRVRAEEAAFAPGYMALSDKCNLECSAVMVAADERDAKIQAIRNRYGMDEADDRSESLTDRFVGARDALMDIPAPDVTALRWKLDQLLDADGGMPAWSASFVRQTFADIARLLPQGA